jgi:hypothetical protein
VISIAGKSAAKDCISYWGAGQPPSPNEIAMLAFCFAPVLGCLTSGQSSAFLLLGFCLFLYFHQRRPFTAGAALLLMAIKPHLFLVFWPLVLIVCILAELFDCSPAVAGVCVKIAPLRSCSGRIQ